MHYDEQVLHWKREYISIYMEVNRITVKTVLQGILLDLFLFRRYFTKQVSSSVVKIRQ